MNNSGPISLGGPTSGVSIEEELYIDLGSYQSNGLGAISLGDAAVAALAGKTQGTQITIPGDFYGKVAASASLPNPGGTLTTFSEAPGYNSGILLLIILPSGLGSNEINTYFSGSGYTPSAWDVWVLNIVGTNSQYTLLGNINPNPVSQSSWSLELTGYSLSGYLQPYYTTEVDITQSVGWTNLGSYGYVAYSISGSQESSGNYTYKGANRMQFTVNLALTANTSNVLASQQYTLNANNVLAGSSHSGGPSGSP